MLRSRVSVRAFTSLWLFSLSLLALTACGRPDYSSKLDATAVAAGVYNNPIEPPIYDLIDGAKRSIDIEIYEIGDPDIRLALIDAAKRDVKVRIVIEPKPVGVSCDVLGKDGNNDETCKVRREALAELDRAGIEIKPFSKKLCGVEGKHCFQHGKLLIADDKKALISTGNFNSSSVCNLDQNPSKCNRDYSVVVDDKQVVETLGKIFEKDRLGERYDLDGMLTKSVRKKLTVSPHALDSLVDFIETADESVYVQAQYLKEPQVNAALIKVAKKGVKVAVTLSSLCSFTTNIEDSTQDNLENVYEPLVEAGIDVQFFTRLNEIKGRPAYMHAKLIVVDEEKAWIGSINGSTMSFSQNREFGVFTEKAAWVNKVTAIFKDDHYNDANEPLAANLKCEKEK